MAFSELCTFGKYYCFGCCIIDGAVPSRKDLESAFKRNTLAFKQFKNLKSFAERENTGAIRACGVCNNLIWKNNKIICPLHPKLAGKDLRKRTFCFKDYLCHTAEIFNKWPEEKQKRFLKFIKSKNPDWYTFSMNIENGSWLKEFKQREARQQ
ncbi:hypothetical protein KY338_00280 [Candidatus Woesearchaeota archaeon]|nr:hypothetical protein [Candidatus Woesearchaeota archaeon]MBW3005241.1 hypothetical protein [Candidatus Woesearchaeota archaeon]